MPVLIATKHITGGEDTFVNQDPPFRNRNYGHSDAIWVRNGAGNDCRGLLIGYLPSFFYGSSVLSATLRIRLATAAPSTNVLRVSAITSSWNYSKTTWNHLNPTISTTHFVNHTITSGQTGWLNINIAPIISAVAAGTLTWRGLLLSMTGADNKLFRFYSMNYRLTDYRPHIVIEYSRPPLAPTICEPSGNKAVDTLTPRLIFNFNDPDGASDTLSAFSIKIYDDTLNLIHDSEEVVSSDAWYDVPAEANLEWNKFYNWNVAVKDSYEVWSPRSTYFRFTTNRKPTVSFTYPLGSVVETTTPIIEWSYSDPEENPQGWYQLLLQKLIKNVYRTVYDSGRIKSGNTEHQIPAGYIVSPDDYYRLVLRVCDNVARVALPDSLPYVEKTRSFRFVPTVEVSPVTSIRVTQLKPKEPGVKIEWEREDNPNEWQIWRKREDEETFSLVATIEDETARSYIDYTCGREKKYAYQVWAVLAGKPSANNPTAEITIDFDPCWLVSQDFPEYNCPVLFWDDAQFPGDVSESSTVYEPLGRRDPVVVTQKVGGFRGTVKTNLINYRTFTAQELYKRMQNLRMVSKSYDLHFLGRWQTWKVRIINLQLEPLIEPEEAYSCSFDLVQVGGFDVSD